MKVLFVMSFYPNNPRNIKLIKYLKKYFEVKSCFLADKNQDIYNEDQKEFVFNKMRVNDKKSKLIALFFFFKYLRKTIKNYSPDLIIAYHWETLILTRLATIFLKEIKIVYDISDIPAYSRFLHKFLKNMEEIFINKKIFLLYASPFFKEKYLKYRSNKSFVLNNKPEKKFIEDYLKHKVISENIVVSFFGVFRDYEIFKNIFEAAKGLPIELKLRGSGFLKEKIKKCSENYENVKIGDEFLYEELSHLYKDTEIILSLYSNRDENTYLALGNKFFEAMALKKIALFPEKTKMAEIVEKYNIGLVVNPYSIESIRQSFIDILENTNNIKKIKKNLLNIKEEEIFYEYEVEKFLSHLKNFLKND